MSTATNLETPIWVQNRIVGFFNHARNIEMILDGTIQDDPSDGPGKTLGRTLAARILRERNLLPRRRFSSLEQIDNIRGVGPSTLQDLVYSFGKTADETFRNSMYESGTIYQENWPLEYFRYAFEDQETFRSLVQDKAQLRTFIQDKVLEVSQEREVAQDNCDAMLADLEKAYIDTYSNSTPIAGYALALWFYDFDADNWFSWERIQEQTIAYFDHNMNTDEWSMDLHLFKGFINRGIIQPGISPNALPVVVNWAESSITFWISELYD